MSYLHHTPLNPPTNIHHHIMMPTASPSSSATYPMNLNSHHHAFSQISNYNSTNNNSNIILPPFDPDDPLFQVASSSSDHFVFNTNVPPFDNEMISIPQLHASPSSSHQTISSNHAVGIQPNSATTPSNNLIPMSDDNMLYSNNSSTIHNNPLNSLMNNSSQQQPPPTPTTPSTPGEKKKKVGEGVVRKLCCLCENEKGHPNGFLVAVDQIKRIPPHLSYLVSDKHLDYLKKQRQAKNICCDQCWETKIQPLIGNTSSSSVDGSNTPTTATPNTLNDGSMYGSNLIFNNYSGGSNVMNTLMMNSTLNNNSNRSYSTMNLNNNLNHQLTTMNPLNNTPPPTNIITQLTPQDFTDTKRKITSPKSKQKAPKKQKKQEQAPSTPVNLTFDQVYNKPIDVRKQFLMEKVEPMLLNDVCRGNKEAFHTLLEDLSQNKHFTIQNYRLETLLKPARNVNKPISSAQITRLILRKRKK
ncbi:hypothetical protein FDP41_009698 [Naegleria fowleri]|uniref:Uncharacterized protein n=1 Tax=Naegleria fowleri TaxID=5763 RepID=A0A6A5BA68_NAEFO|nr:uncharacterized protein FDP41_009698 [Naegleria fowleri]KAF0972002.1 hypothetical protein FDP41_009698 [Naegleria fowleri]CAG4719248.1 unnamed protein product [Naegleria fowleri]